MIPPTSKIGGAICAPNENVWNSMRYYFSVDLSFEKATSTEELNVSKYDNVFKTGSNLITYRHVYSYF